MAMDGRALQELVRNVVSAVTNLNSPTDGQQTNSPPTRGFSSPEEEISARFQHNTPLSRDQPRGTRGASSRFNPQHNYSFTKKKKKNQNEVRADLCYKDVCLLPSPNWNQVPRGQAKAELIHRGLYVDAMQIDKNWPEIILYNKLRHLFENQLDSGRQWKDPIMFEFVKSSGSMIVPMSLPHGQERNAKVIKHVSGQGPIYIRALEELEDNKNYSKDDSDNDVIMIKPKDTSENYESESDSDLMHSSLEITTCTRSSLRARPVTSTITGTSSSAEPSTVTSTITGTSSSAEPSTVTSTITGTSSSAEPPTLVIETSAGPSGITGFCSSEQPYRPSTNGIVDQLKEMFPDTPSCKVVDVAQFSTSLEEAIEKLLENDQEKDITLERILGPLCAQLEMEPCIRLQVEQEDLVNDVVAFYKGPTFKANQPIRVTYVGQPALDSGGVRRQLYNDFFFQLANENQLKLFQGPIDRLLLNYNQTALSCGLFKMLGQMIAHSICQNCCGFPYLAPSMYYYLVTEDYTKASAYASIVDISDKEEAAYVEKAMLGDPAQIEELTNDDGFLKLMSDSGLTVMLTLNNHQMVAQCITAHLVLSKRIAALQQFAHGLDTLGVLSALRSHPSSFEVLFVTSKVITPENVKKMMRLKESFTENTSRATTVFKMLINYIEDCNEDELKNLLKFTTGACSTNSGYIDVDVCTQTDSIYASTCLCELVLPDSLAMIPFEEFKLVIQAALSFQTFNCV